MNKEPIKILRDILINCMNLTNEQIWIYNQDFKIPETSGLFIVLDYGTEEDYANINEFIPADVGVEGAQQSISVMTKENYIVNIMSKNDEARLRKKEVSMSLNSDFSQNQQGLYQFQIARVKNNSSNVSFLEGAGMLNRFVINITLTAHYNQTIDTVYYDDFTNQINID